MIMIGESAGLTFRKVGGFGRLVGNCPVAALIAACTSRAAASMLRLRSNCKVIWVLPSALCEVIGDKPAISEKWRSKGCATFEAMVSGLPPGKLAETWIVGKSTYGSGATGSKGQTAMPTSKMAMASSVVPIGRWMKLAETLTLHILSQRWPR